MNPHFAPLPLLSPPACHVLAKFHGLPSIVTGDTTSMSPELNAIKDSHLVAVGIPIGSYRLAVDYLLDIHLIVDSYLLSEKYLLDIR